MLAAALVIAIGGGVVAYRSLSAETTATIDDSGAGDRGPRGDDRGDAPRRVPAGRRSGSPLTATDAAAGAAGTLLFSPSTGELVVVASGLAPARRGQEYGCWIEVDGDRTRIGKMYSGGDIQAWAGPVDGLADVPEDATFGVSLGPAAAAAMRRRS